MTNTTDTTVTDETIFLLHTDKKCVIDGEKFNNWHIEAGESVEALIKYIKEYYHVEILAKDPADDFPYFTDGGFKYTATARNWLYTFTCFPHKLLKAPPKNPDSIKPPIGIIPEWLWKEKRMEELEEAIHRYDFDGKPREKEWVDEYSQLREWLHNWNENKKPPKKTVLFTTHDGVPLYNQDDKCFWLRLDTWATGKQTCVHVDLSNTEGNFKYFSTEQAANEYALLNRPCLSINDIQTAYSKGRSFVGTDFLINGLKELVKSKIEGGI